MATSNYPSSLDTTSALPASISDTANLNSPNHAEMHEVYNDAIIEIEEKLGTGDTTPTSGAILIGTGTGASAWDTTPMFVNDVTVLTGRLFSAGGDDVDLDALSGSAIIGSADGSGAHIAIDTNEIQAKSDTTTAADLNLNILGGQVKIHTGTNSAPALTFTGDDDTGIYRAAANKIGFATGGTARVEISVQSASTDDSAMRMVGAEGANLLSFTNVPSYDTVGDYGAFFHKDSSNVYYLAGTFTPSTREVKKNITDASDLGARFLQNKLYQYEYDIDKLTDKAPNAVRRINDGEKYEWFIAEEVKSNTPELVGEDNGLPVIKDGPPLQKAMIAAIFELNKRLSALEG